MEAHSKSRAGAVNPGVPLMMLSFLVVAGFLWWLSRTAEPTESPADAPAAEDEAVNQVPLADFFANTSAYMGQEVTLTEIAVTSLLGPHAFWTALGEAFGNPYLVHLSEAVRADSVVVTPGVPVTVTGTVHAMSDSILADWDEAGAFPQESDRFQAEFAQSFLEVASVTEVASADPAQGADGPSS